MEFKKNQNVKIILILLAIIFFFAYSYLSLITPAIFNSPDETANFVFIRQFAQTGQLKISEPLNQSAGNIIHPRSVNVTPNGDLAPGGFLGLILIYGWLAKIFGLGLVKFLTPLFAAAAVLFFYGLVRKIFNERVAWLSAILLFISPAWWYYASRGLLPNVLSVSLLIIGFYLLTIKRYWSWGLAGLFFGLALSVRLVDALWLVPVLVILLLTHIRQLKKSDWLAIILSAGMMALAFWPTWHYQQVTYGGAWKSGYAALEVGAADRGNFFPFGFHPRLVVKNFFDYYIWFFWWLFLPSLGGWWLWLKDYKKNSKLQKIFLGLGLLVSVFLIVYYGSGVFNDNPTPWRTTIGDSHIRYWLPVCIFTLPLIALFLSRIKKIWLGTILSVIIYFSFNSVLWRDEEGLLAIKKNILDYNRRGQAVKEITPPDSAIIVQRGDKLFFPSRRVINFNDFLAKPEVWVQLANRAPLYGYLDFSEKDLSDFAAILSQPGFVIEKIKDFENNEDLYEIKK